MVRWARQLQTALIPYRVALLLPYARNPAPVRSLLSDLNQLWHVDKDLMCGPPADAVFFGNIMYSAHLAQIAVLYELFSRQTGTTEPISFQIAGNTYSLDNLMERIMLQATENADELGGGITCEPANMYGPKINPPSFHPFSSLPLPFFSLSLSLSLKIARPCHDTPVSANPIDSSFPSPRPNLNHNHTPT